MGAEEEAAALSGQIDEGRQHKRDVLAEVVEVERQVGVMGTVLSSNISCFRARLCMQEGVEVERQVEAMGATRACLRGGEGHERMTQGENGRLRHPIPWPDMSLRCTLAIHFVKERCLLSAIKPM